MVQTLNLPPSLEIQGAIATLRLRRPGLANRLGVGDMATLEAHVQLLAQREDIRVLLLRSEGAHFCAGFQIDAVGSLDAPALFERVVGAWAALPQITLALIQGDAWGGAVDLALACDFRLGTPQGRMGVPAARLGLHFHAGGMQRLVSRLGLSAAKRLLLAGEVWEGEQRLQRGFLDDCDDALDALAAQWSERLLALAPLAQRGMKRHLNALAAGELDPAQLALDQARCAASADLAEGLAAWQARRAPRFAGV